MYAIIFIACFGVGFMQGVEILDPTKMIGRIYFLMPLAIKSTTETAYLLLFIGVNLISFLAIAVVCAITYKKMNSLITAKKRAKDFRLKNYGGKTKSNALLSRELTRFFSIPIYAMNSLVGIVLGVIGTIALAVVVRSQMGGYIAELMLFLPIILAFTFMMAPATNCSISLEGKSYWIIKTLPVSSKDLIKAKLMVNNIFGVLPAFIAGLVSTIIFGAPYYEVILITAMAVGVSLLGGGIGLLANLLFPLLNWENPNKPVKQSLSVFLTILSAMFFAGGFFALSYFVPFKPIYILLIMFGIVVAFNIVVYGVIHYKGEKLLSKI
jgi:ABC-2 type transport system permease protein